MSAPETPLQCLCNHCSRAIPLESEHQAGQEVACPHCGMETLLYVPHAPRSESPPKQPPPPTPLPKPEPEPESNGSSLAIPPFRSSGYTAICWVAGVMGAFSLLLSGSAWAFGDQQTMLLFLGLSGICFGCAFASHIAGRIDETNHILYHTAGRRLS